MVIMPEIFFDTRLLSQLMHKPRGIHWKTEVLAYIKNSFRKRLFYKKYGYVHISIFSNVNVEDKDDKKFLTGHLTFVRGNQVTLRSKKEDRVSIFY